MIVDSWLELELANKLRGKIVVGSIVLEIRNENQLSVSKTPFKELSEDHFLVLVSQTMKKKKMKDEILVLFFISAIRITQT